MTLYVVKHGTDDWRFHKSDGTEISSGTSRPDQRTQADWLATYHNGASILGDPDARRQFTDIVTGDVVVKDLTASGETVPWQ